MTIFFFDKAETVIMGRVSNSGQKTLSAIHLACNLSDTGLVAVGGKRIKFFFLITQSSTFFRQLHT